MHRPDSAGRVGIAATLRTDRIIQLSALVFAGFLGLYGVSLVLDREPRLLRRLAGLSFLGLALAALVHGRRKITNREEVRFWRDLLLAFSSWFAVSVLYLFYLTPEKPTVIEIVAETLLLLFYVFFILAVERRPEERSRWRLYAVERALTWPAVTVFALGLHLYFNLVPRLVVGRNDSHGYIYVILDVYLLVKLVLLARRADEERWKKIYAALSLVPLFMLISDLDEHLQYANLIPLHWGSWKDLVIVLPMIALVIATRLRHHPFPAAHSFNDDFRYTLAGPAGQTMVSALTFPLVHFLCSSQGMLEAATLAAREYMVGAWLLLLGTIALAQHRRLERELQSMWLERKQAERALDRSEKNMRLMMERESAETAVSEAEGDAWNVWLDRLRVQADVLERARDAALLFDHEGRITYWNAAAEKLYGYTADEILGCAITELCPSGTGPGEEVHRRLAENTSWCGHLKPLHRDGRQILVESHWSGIRGTDGELRATLILATEAE